MIVQDEIKKTSPDLLLTIGMPVFNDVHFIEKSLESILTQRFHDFELIISDDGSTDGSEAICKKYAEKDSRIKYIRQQKNIGISKNMMFLLSQAKTKYFMWAGDDDILEPTFIDKLIDSLEKNTDCIVAFCNYNFIDENGNLIGNKQIFDYSGKTAKLRLKKFIKNSNDIFGYGVFLTEKIKDVQFPVWSWPNKNTPLNNIFPSLCFYLAKGNYVHIHDKSLFFKRTKPPKHTNYKTSFSSKGFIDIVAYIMRRFNLVCFSAKMIKKGGGFSLALYSFPILLYHWYIISSLREIKSAITNKIKRN